jgi:LmbE family N-acetylglucosaminyl deacetylase
MSVLAFSAHPDDETMLAGGTLALLGRAGAQVQSLCATRGEGGETWEPSDEVMRVLDRWRRVCRI